MPPQDPAPPVPSANESCCPPCSPYHLRGCSSGRRVPRRSESLAGASILLPASGGPSSLSDQHPTRRREFEPVKTALRLPTSAAATPAAAPTAEPAESAAEPSAATKPAKAATPSAERPDSAVPRAPRGAAP